MNFFEHIQNFKDDDLDALPIERQVRITKIGLLSAISGHIVRMMLFLYIGEYSLVLINILSIAFFLFVWHLGNRGYFTVGVWILIVQIVSFSLVMTHMLGYESNFYYFLLVLIILPVLFKSPNPVFFAVMGSVGMAGYLVAVSSSGYFGAGAIILEPFYLQLLGLFNIFHTFLFIGVLLYIHSYYTYRLDKRLFLEQTYSDFLLEKILPKYIIENIKKGDQDAVNEFPLASVAFLDIVGFTALSAKKTPKETVELLNAFFSLCDQLAIKHQVDKIKTIGDSYMAASGANENNNGKDDAIRLVAFSLEVIDALSKSLRSSKCHGVHVRAGINSGAIMAGVIGDQRLAFDMWGHTVNVASRLEASGFIDRVAISKETYELVHEKFELEEVKTVWLKGMGETDMYFLKNRSF